MHTFNAYGTTSKTFRCPNDLAQWIEAQTKRPHKSQWGGTYFPNLSQVIVEALKAAKATQEADDAAAAKKAAKPVVTKSTRPGQRKTVQKRLPVK